MRVRCLSIVAGCGDSKIPDMIERLASFPVYKGAPSTVQLLSVALGSFILFLTQVTQLYKSTAKIWLIVKKTLNGFWKGI